MASRDIFAAVSMRVVEFELSGLVQPGEIIA